MADEYFEQEDKSTLALVKRHARAVLHGFAIAISAEKIHPRLTGTYEVAVQLSHALSQDDRVASVYWVAEGERLEALSGLVRDVGLDVEVVSLHDLRAGAIDVDVAFLPHQDHEGTFWPRVADRAHRNIVWQLDLIAALNPHYQESWTAFDRLNEAVERSIDNADAIGVLTPHVGEGLRSRFFGASPKHIFYLPAGAPHDRFERSGRVSISRHVPAIDRPEIEGLSGLPFILVLGTNYLHKNVVWFMRLALLVRSLGWDGKVVIAGPTPGGGGDSTQSQGDLIGLTGSEDVFVQLGTVSEVEKHWLFEHATLVASPAITEGWGMVPAEAALLGTVAIATIGGGLRDVSPPNASVLLMEDDAVDAQVVFELLTNDDRRREQLDAWLAAANGFRWDRAAAHLVDACASVLLQRRTIQVPSGRSFDAANLEAAAAASPTEEGRPLVPTRLRRTLLIRSLRWFPPGGRKRRVLKSAFGWAVRW
jgi:glycosyltransferase involved in cell wall biosynthesis